jgi:hypothetical protein
MPSVDLFISGTLSYLDECAKENGVKLPPKAEIKQDLRSGAEHLAGYGWLGIYAARFPKSWGITQQVRYKVLRRLQKIDYDGEPYICSDFYTNTGSRSYYGNEMEVYADGDRPDVICILKSAKAGENVDPHLFFCGLPYDDYANIHLEGNWYDTTQLLEFSRLARLMNETTGCNFVIVHPGTQVDVIGTQKLQKTPIDHQLMRYGYSRALSRKGSTVTTSGDNSCVANVSVGGDGQVHLHGDYGEEYSNYGLLLALVGKKRVYV